MWASNKRFMKKLQGRRWLSNCNGFKTTLQIYLGAEIISWWPGWSKKIKTKYFDNRLSYKQYIQARATHTVCFLSNVKLFFVIHDSDGSFGLFVGQIRAFETKTTIIIIAEELSKSIWLGACVRKVHSRTARSLNTHQKLCTATAYIRV